jgi:hypothetical protein
LTNRHSVQAGTIADNEIAGINLTRDYMGYVLENADIFDSKSHSPTTMPINSRQAD